MLIEGKVVVGEIFKLIVEPGIGVCGDVVVVRLCLRSSIIGSVEAVRVAL